MAKLYAVPCVPFQPFAADLCWGSCGKGIVGAIDIPMGNGGIACIACRQDDCPHLDRQMDDSMGDVNGEPVYLRKLRKPGGQP